MFRSFIYLDEDKLTTYMRQLSGKNVATPTTMTRKQTSGIQASFNGFGINSGRETNVNEQFQRDLSFDYDSFEQALSRVEGEEYYDLALNGDYDLMTLPGMKIVRLCNGFSIPEEFDMINLVEQFKPMLMGQIQTNSEGEQKALENVVGKASADIPILIDSDLTIAAKLNTQYLYEEYSTLEDYSDQDVYILCKTVGVVHRDEVIIFDPLKDFIRLPRVARRQLESQGTSIGLEKIKTEGPVLKVEVIAIYK